MLRITRNFFIHDGLPHILGEMSNNYRKVQKVVEDYFKPSHGYLQLAANRVAMAEWRLGRDYTLSCAAVNYDVCSQVQTVENEFTSIRTPERLWLAYRKTATFAGFAALSRDENRALQIHRHSTAELRAARSGK